MALTGKIYLVTTLDTKWEEIVYIKKLLNLKKLDCKIDDISTQHHQFNHLATVEAETVANYHPNGKQAVFCGDRGKAIVAMADAFKLFLIAQNDVEAILGLGGSGGTALITPAMSS
jgi:uncharacterized protein (UPF0261 family)